MEQTTNYGLNKPGGSDYARIDVLNANMDAVDAALKELEESKAAGAALAAHEADGVKHVSAAERTAWNAKADGTATSAHIANTNNPHGVTAAQVGAVPTTRKVNGKALSADVTLTAGDVGAFGMLGSSTTADLDTCKTPGCLLVHNSCANWPAGETADWGLLWIVANGSGGVVQTLTVRLTSTTKPTKAYYRMYSGDVWSVWGQIATDSDLADIGALQLLTGSYVGTGVSGSGNPNSITFSRVPRLIMLLGTKTSDGEYHPLFGADSGSYYVHLVYADMLTTAYQKGLGLSNYSSLNIYGKKSSDGKTFSWYYDATDKANYQCNVSGTTYYYAALC